MEKVIYVDVLLAVNYIVNWLLIKASAKLSGQPIKGIRVMLSAAFGAATSLLIFIPEMSVALWLIAKISISLAMAGIAFSFSSYSGLLKLWFVFLNVSLVFAGGMYALYSSFSEMVLWYNGIVYFDISSVTLIISSIVCYSVLWIFDKIFSKLRTSGDYISLNIEFQGKKIAIMAIEDTGNKLCEPFSGLPVIVCSLEAGLSIIPELWLDWVCKVITGKGQMGLVPSGCRLISYRGIGANGMLPAIRPDKIVIKTSSGITFNCDGYLAFSDSLSHGKYKAVVNPQILKLSL